VLDQGAVWKVSKELRGKAEWVPHTTKFIRNGTGSLATTPAEQVRNFCEFYTPVYNSVTPPRGWQQLAKFPPRDTDRTILPPQRFQVLKAIRSLRKTSSGRSGVPLDVWRTLVTDDEALGIITGLFVECWETNTVPDAWKVAHLIAIYKKHDPTLAKNYRLIFVEEHLSKAFQHLIKQHLDSHFETIAPEFSNGFRARRGCADALFILKQVLRKRKEHGLHSWLLLLDIQRAFDVVPRELLWACLLKCGVPPKLVQVLQGLYSDRTAEMSLEGYSQFMTADGGTCQGALLAPRLFSYFIYTIFEVWMHENPTSATELCYHEDPRSRSRAAAIKFFVSLFNVADDTAAIFDSRPALERHGLGLIKILQDFGLQVHLASAQSIAEGVAPKTAIMHIAPQGPARFDPVDHQPITVAPGFFIPVVDTYTYLGVLLHRSLSDDHEILVRVQKAQQYFGSLRKIIFASRSTHRSTKKIAYEGMVLAVLLYGSEGWILSKISEQRLQTAHRYMVRTMCGVCMYHTRKYEILAADLEARLQLRSIRDYIDARVLGYAGHAARMPITRWPRRMLACFCAATRPVGAPPLTYATQLSRICARKSPQPAAHWFDLASNRSAWREFIRRPTPAPARAPPVDFSGRRVCCPPNYDCGTVLGQGDFDSIPAWATWMDNGSVRYFDRAKLQRLLLGTFDPLDRATQILQCPRSIVGRAVQWRHDNAFFNGYITDHDLDHRGQTLWGVKFLDGDAADFYANDIILMLDHDAQAPLLGQRVAKYFDNILHRGYVRSCDTDIATNERIWNIAYPDGGEEDLNLPELLEVLLLGAAA
jgi:hypothetical protein